jgi:hypothetical protein
LPFLAFPAPGPSDRLVLCPSSLLAFGNVPAPSTHCAEDTTLGYPLAKTFEQTLLRFSRFQLNSHSASITPSCTLLQRQKKARLLASSHAMRVEPSFPNISHLGKIWCPVQDNGPLPPPEEVWNMRAVNLVHCEPLKRSSRSGGHRPFAKLWVSQSAGRSFSPAPPVIIIPYLTVLVNRLWKRRRRPTENTSNSTLPAQSRLVSAKPECPPE